MMTTTNKTEDVSKWFDLYADYLFNYCFVKVNDRELAKDLVQDTFIAGIQGLDSFKGKSEIKTWLTSILKRKIFDHMRKKTARKTYAMSSFFSGESQQAWDDKHIPRDMTFDLESELHNKELGDVLKESISSLPAKWKQVFIDKMINENDSEVICRKNNLTPSNFWIIMHRSKLKMRLDIERRWL